MSSRARTWLLRIGAGVVALLVVIALALGWLLYTTAGLRFALDRGVAATHGQFGYATASGSLAHGATLEGLRYRNDDGTRLSIARATLDLRPWALLARRLHVRKARIDGVTLDLWPSRSPAPASGNPLQPPLTIALDDLVLTRIAISESGKPAFAADSLALSARWSRRELVIGHLALRAPAGSIDLAGSLATHGKPRGQARASIDWIAQGTRYSGTLAATSDGATARLDADLTAPLRANVDASVALDPRHAWSLALKAPTFAAHALPGLPAAIKSLAVDLHGSGDTGGGKLGGTLAANDHVVALDPAQFRYDGHALTLAPLRLTSPAMPGVAGMHGTIQLDASPVHATLDVDWRDVQLPADLVGQPLATHGALRFDGSAARFALKGALALGPPDRLAKVQLDLDGTPRAITLKTLQLVQAEGGLDAHGSIGLQPALGWKLDATAKRFDPGALVVGWNGALDFTLATQGQLTPRGLDATLKLGDAVGTLRGRNITGSKADFATTPGNLLAGSLDLVAGGSRIHASGKPGARTDASIGIEIASLGDWLPAATGSLRGAFDVRGAWPKLAVSGHLDASKLAYAGHSLDTLRLTANVPDIAQPGGKLDLALAGVKAGDFSFANIHLAGSGTASAHTLQLSASGTPLGATLALQGRWNAGTRAWTGSLRDLELVPQGMPAWRQQQATALAWKDGAASLGRLCLSAGAPQLCVDGSRNANGTATASYNLRDLPLQLLATLAGGANPLLASGDVSGSGKLTQAANGTLCGSASLATSTGQLAFASSVNQPLLAWIRISVDATETGGNQHLALSGILVDGGHLNGAINLRGGALDGTLVADLRSLVFVGALSPELANAKGSLAGTLQLGGTLAAPRFAGSIQTHDFSAELPRAGLKLRDGTFAVSGDAAGKLAIRGEVGSGKGTLHVEGSTGLAADAPLQLAIKGDSVLVADIPAAHVVASPDLNLARTHGVYALTGSIAIPSARIEAEKLPGQGPTAASPDIVIVDAPPVEQVAPLALAADITVKLGDDVKLHGYGLDGSVEGQLAVRVDPGKPATGRGQISVAGKYQAYGQDLSIERGRLLFAATPLDNPGLDIRAVRKIQGQSITVGLAVRATAQRPVLTVFSDPAMEQAEALSYLVTGRSMETLKSGEGDTLNTAAQALGGLAGDRLAKSIGARLGIEAGVSSSEALGGTAFTAGKYLSPRLFLSYGVGLFTPGQVITLRYTLNRFLQFEAENATTGNRASLNYRIEK